MSEGDELIGIERVHADLRADDTVGGCKAGKGDAGSIWRPMGGKGNAAERRELVLVGAIVIHDPEFFVARARTDKSDLSGGDAGESAGKFIDDFVSELMSEFADLCISGVAAVDLADDGLGRGIADVKHPGGDRDFGGSFREIAEGDEIGVDGHVGPGKIAKFGGLRRRLRWIKAGRDEVENAGEGQIVADNLSEKRGVGLGRVGAGSKIGHCNARLFDAETGAGAEPTLFLLGEGEDWTDQKKEEDGNEFFQRQVGLRILARG